MYSFSHSARREKKVSRFCFVGSSKMWQGLYFYLHIQYQTTPFKDSTGVTLSSRKSEHHFGWWAVEMLWETDAIMVSLYSLWQSHDRTILFPDRLIRFWGNVLRFHPLLLFLSFVSIMGFQERQNSVTWKSPPLIFIASFSSSVFEKCSAFQKF